MKRLKIYDGIVQTGFPFGFWIPGLGDKVYVLPGQKIEINITERGDGRFNIVTIDRLSNDGYTVGSDEWLPE